MIKDHVGAPIATISPADIHTYYLLSERYEVFNTRWLSEFVTLVKDILMECWQDLSKFQVRTD